MEPRIILAIQHALASDVGRALIGFSARWLIYLYIPFTLAARASRVMRHAVYEASWAAAIALALSTLIANLVDRARPYVAVPGVEAIVPPNIQAGSFPSSHTAVAFAIASALAFQHLPLGIAAFVMAFLIAFGRVAAGMHYPTDVLGGAVVGIVAFGIVRLVHAGLARIS